MTPFSPGELVARVRALLRRRSALPGAGRPMRRSELLVDAGRHEASRLTPTEFDLLACLMEHAGLALSREHLLDRVWGTGEYGDPRVVDVHVRHLREKLGATGERYVRTVRGVGYKLADDPGHALIDP